MKIETLAYCHQRNTSEMWSWTPAPVRNLHVLQNSSNVSSFFKRVLDTFKYDGIFMKIETLANCHQRNTSKMWSWTSTSVRNLHVLLNSSRVSSFFTRVLDTFKHEGFSWKFELKLIVIIGTHSRTPELVRFNLSLWKTGSTLRR